MRYPVTCTRRRRKSSLQNANEIAILGHELAQRAQAEWGKNVTLEGITGVSNDETAVMSAEETGVFVHPNMRLLAMP
ncbi:hypothetical protein LMG29542_07513 [Paraburkholderia humisilvae]|uniref:Uncharacterized protein n=1 Tax=Paraburkholderia humisilvae TaxID=627669 RepID=A0A6J5F6D8_9BURK|nr:hypothetical protein LMG29542_07513 [Paraburkholderia humisilvae]